MNGRLIYHNLITRLTTVNITASSMASGYTPNNLGVPVPGCIWRPSTYSGTQWVRFSLGTSAKQASAWAIIGDGLVDAHPTIRLKVETVSGSGMFDITLDTITFLNHPEYEPLVLGTFTPTSKKYWRVEITGAASTYGLGLIFLSDNVYEFEEPADSPVADSYRDQVVSAETDGGHERRDERGELYRETSLSWGNISQDFRDELWDVHADSEGRLHPVVYQPEDVGQYNPGPGRYAEISSFLTTERAGSGRYGASLGLKEITS